MLKNEHRALKYIYKHPRISKSDLLKKFPDFESYNIFKYLYIENLIEKMLSEIECSLHVKASELRLNVSESSDYVRSHMPDIESDNSFIFYSTNKEYAEYCDKRKWNFLKVAIPLAITSVIAIAAIIVEFFV